jgi:LPXTG-site transpeptidase (sortase) family protein
MGTVKNTGSWVARHPWPFAAVAVVVAIVATAVGMLALVGGGQEPPLSTAEIYRDLGERQQARDDVRAEETPVSVLVEPTAVPTPVLYTSAVTRLRVERVGIDAPVETRGIDANNTMESPDGPYNVAWYDFTPKPGMGGNAAFSGHVDYINHGPAVFWRLRELVAGDIIEVQLEDGTRLRYAVTGMESYPLDTIPMAEVLAPTSVDSVTLITCDGDARGGSYSHRLVVRATRTEVIPPAG